MLTTDVVNLPNSELESHRVHNLIRNARRRVVGQRFLNQSLSAIAIALCIAVVAYLSLPLYQSVMPAVQTLLLICAGIFSVCLAVAWVSSLTKRPSFDAIAIEVDRRFQFAERLTTVTQLTPNERHSAAARALLQDTQAKLSTIKLADQFPVQPTRWAWGVPIFGAAMALAIVFYEPDFSKASENSSSTEVTLNDTKKPETPKPASSIAKPDQQQLPKNSMERKKSVELENLQNELNETMKKWQQTPATTDEQQREKVTELTRSKACMSCHSIINPLGFSLEHYDAIGRWRNSEQNKPINDDSVLQTDSGERFEFSGPHEVARFAAESTIGQDAFVRQLFQHTVKQPHLAYGLDALPSLQKQFRDTGCNIRNLLVKIAVTAASPPQPPSS